MPLIPLFEASRQSFEGTEKPELGGWIGLNGVTELTRLCEGGLEFALHGSEFALERRVVEFDQLELQADRGQRLTEFIVYGFG